MTKIVFLDTETTGLADECDIWEIGLIARKTLDEVADHIDLEYCWQFRPSMVRAEPTGLRIGRYYERVGDLARARQGSGRTMTTAASIGADDVAEAAADIARLLDGATIVGAVPDFDARHLSRWLAERGQCGTWHYHLVDVETLAAGALRKPPPWDFDSLLATFGLSYDEADRHTALGDARMVRDLYDAILTRNGE